MVGALIGAGLQLATGIIKGIKGRKARKAGEKAMQETRPRMKIPGAIDANYAQAQNELGGKPAVQQAMEDSAQQQLAGNLSAVRRYATSSADALAAASGASNVANQGMAEAAAAGGQQRGQALQNVMNAGNQLGDYQSMQWDMNVNQPYLQRMEFAQGKMAAGQAQEQSALSDIGGAAGGIGTGISGLIGRKNPNTVI
jgi:hypothetical protein